MHHGMICRYKRFADTYELQIQTENLFEVFRAMARATSLDAEQHVQQIARDGFTIIPELLNADEVAACSVELDALLGRHRGRNDFEGFQTERIYTLINHGKRFQDLCEHPQIIEVIDRLLSPGYLLSVAQAIAMSPGETPQEFHRDDGYYPAVASGLPQSVSTMIAIDPFTSINGATEMVVGSHLWTPSDYQAARRGSADELGRAMRALQVLQMPAGSCALWVGGTIHRGGANQSSSIRRSITNQYCNPWLRPQESFLLSVPRETASLTSPRLQAMLGYDIVPPFMGHLTGLHPRRVFKD